MNKSEQHTKYIYLIIVATLFIFILHFIVLYFSRTHLISNTNDIKLYTSNNASIQRIVKNSLSNRNNNVNINELNKQINIMDRQNHFDEENRLVIEKYNAQWEHLKLIIEDYTSHPSEENKLKLLNQSEITWYEGENLINLVENEINTDLRLFWWMLLLLFISFFALIMVLIYIKNTVQGSLMSLALRDPLTGCFNRNYFNEVFNEQTKLYNRYHHVFSIAILDLDNFKRVNDEFGHDIGDVVLKQFVKIIRSQIRSSDILVRYGGEEFLILFPNTDLKNAKTICDKLILAIDNNEDFPCGHITTSIGLGAVQYENNQSKDVMKEADIALYHAKASGKNQVQIYQP